MASSHSNYTPVAFARRWSAHVILRFEAGAPQRCTMPGLYDAAIEMAAWAKDRGGVAP